MPVARRLETINVIWSGMINRHGTFICDSYKHQAEHTYIYVIGMNTKLTALAYVYCTRLQN